MQWIETYIRELIRKSYPRGTRFDEIHILNLLGGDLTEKQTAQIKRIIRERLGIRERYYWKLSPNQAARAVRIALEVLGEIEPPQLIPLSITAIQAIFSSSRYDLNVKKDSNRNKWKHFRKCAND